MLVLLLNRSIYIHIHGKTFEGENLCILVKAPPRVQYGKIARGCGQETNIARGVAECYIRLETTPKFNWFIVLV